MHGIRLENIRTALLLTAGEGTEVRSQQGLTAAMLENIRTALLLTAGEGTEVRSQQGLTAAMLAALKVNIFLIQKSTTDKKLYSYAEQ